MRQPVEGRPVSRSLPSTSDHCSNGRFVVTITPRRSYGALVTSTEPGFPKADLDAIVVYGVTSKSVRLPVQKVQHWTGGGHPYGSGPFALATPCTDLPGRYSGPSNRKPCSAPVELGHRLINMRAWTSLTWSLAVGKPGLSA